MISPSVPKQVIGLITVAVITGVMVTLKVIAALGDSQPVAAI